MSSITVTVLSTWHRFARRIIASSHVCSMCVLWWHTTSCETWDWNSVMVVALRYDRLLYNSEVEELCEVILREKKSHAQRTLPFSFLIFAKNMCYTYVNDYFCSEYGNSFTWQLTVRKTIELCSHFDIECVNACPLSFRSFDRIAACHHTAPTSTQHLHINNRFNRIECTINSFIVARKW